MDTIEVIKTRRSIRQYKDTPVTDEQLTAVLEAVQWAPSWANTQCWEMVVVKDPAVKEKLAGKDITIIATEPTACPTLTRGEFRYDFGDTAQLTPLLKMFTLGHTFVPPPIHAGGLRYHGAAPLMCLLAAQKVIDAKKN